ncbi:MAG: hypothetical protein WAO95_09255 [Burkholderiales bacterium]
MARAEALAPSENAATACVAASVDVLADTRNHSLYRIVFVNRCGAPRSLLWCAENPGVPVPAAVACPSGLGFPAEPRHAIARRKEFQWHLPRGSRIRFHDCAGREVPTAGFGCAAR